MVAPGSVVPPGRLIPAKQLWAGNPVEFVKHLDMAELFTNYSLSYVNTFLGDKVMETYTSWPSNYLLKKATKEDVSTPERIDTINENPQINYGNAIYKP